MANSNVIARRAAPLLRAAALPAALLAAWSATARLALVNAELLPSPETVLRTGRELLLGPGFPGAVAASLSRTLAGYAIAVVAGLAVGLLLGVSRRAERLIGPSFHAWRQVAIFAWIPLLSAWFGAGDACKVAFIAVAAVAPVIFNTFVGVRSLPPEYRELARVLEIGRVPFLLRVVLPAAMPQLLVGLQLSLVTAWLATFGSEFFLQIDAGVGNILIEGRSLGRMDVVIVGIAVVGAIGFALNAAVRLVERRLLRWRPSHPHAEG